MKGCNSVNDYHIAHINHKDLVTIEQVRVISLEKFIYTHHVRNIKLLKIDTEGHDVIILQALLVYLQKVRNYFNIDNNRQENNSNNDDIMDYHHHIDHSVCKFCPDRIVFESNALIPIEVIKLLIHDFISFGYIQVYQNDNTILEKSCNG